MSAGLSAGAISLLGAGASVVGGLIAADSAGDALQSQEAGAARSDATQRYQYDTTRADNAPFRQTGVAANTRLAQLMGLGGGAMTREQIRAQLMPSYTTAGTAGTAATQGQPIYNGENEGAGAITGYTQGTAGTAGGVNEAGLNAAVEAQFAQQQQQQSDPSYGSMMRNFSAQDLRDDPVLNASEGYMQPMRDYNASDLENDPLLKAAPGYFQPLRKFGQADLDGDLVYQNGLQFALSEGRRGIENMGAATGSALGGNTLRALARFGGDLATQRTGDAYNRFNTEQNTRQQQKQGSYDRFQTNQNYKYGLRADANNRFNQNRDGQFNRLSTLSGGGQVATAQVGAAGQNYANSVSQTAQNLGNAQGASAIARGNALSGGIQGGIDNYQQGQFLTQMRDRENRLTRGGSGTFRAPADDPMNLYRFGNSGSGG